MTYLTHKKRNVLAAIGGAIILTALIVTALALASCGILHLGNTNADGTPKAPADAMAAIRTLGDAGMIAFGGEYLQREAPAAFAYFDVDSNSVVTLAEIEARINLEDSTSVAMLMLVGKAVYDFQKQKP